MSDLKRAVRGYISRLGSRLVVADENKKPLVAFFPHGVSNATQDLERIDAAIDSCSGATIAARVGDHHVVLDVDVRHLGHVRLAELETVNGPLPKSWRARTATGGEHIWFRHPDFKVRGTLAKGIEVITGNRLVTLPPSSRLGRSYEWTEHPLRTELALPWGWLSEAMREPPTPERTQRENSDSPAVREKRARAFAAKMDPAIQGQNGAKQTMWAALAIFRGFDLDQSTAWSILSEWNKSCDPPWTDHDLKRKLRHAKEYGRKEWGFLLERNEVAA